MAPALTISIPTATTASPSDSKPFTQYHVSLQLPLRRHDIRKRYNDFVALHEALISEAGKPPPAPLPAKSWLRRTVNNASLTEERRVGLEKYVQAIIASDDARWRSSAAWRGFLNLPSSITTSNTPASKRPPDSDGTVPAETARICLDGSGSTHPLCRSQSKSSASKGDDAGWGGTKRLGDGELRRRRDLIGAARKEVEGLEGVLKSMATQSAKTSGSNSGMHASAAATSEQKSALWKGTSAAKPSGRVLGGPMKETERTRELDNSGVLQLQKQIMHEQDEDVMSLGKTVAKLKDMGILINEELAIQNEMLEVVEHDADRVQQKIDVGRARIKKIS
ncbi:hypothetical protein BST61_g5306 [Cercospora zeina]